MHPILVDFATVTVAGRAIPIVIGGYGLMFSLAVIGGWLWFRGLGRQVAPRAPWTDIYFIMILSGLDDQDLPLMTGDRINLIVGYGDWTICLHDQLVGVRKGKVEIVWDILGRGKLT